MRQGRRPRVATRLNYYVRKSLLLQANLHTFKWTVDVRFAPPQPEEALAHPPNVRLSDQYHEVKATYDDDEEVDYLARIAFYIQNEGVCDLNCLFSIFGTLTVIGTLTLGGGARITITWD
jgi:hypothetical protein